MSASTFTSEPETSAAPELDESLDAMLQDLGEMGDTFRANSAARFQAMLPRMITRVLGEGDAARQALADGGFVMNEATVVLRLNPDTDQVEIFCDVGVPDPHGLERAYRAALELNLCRTYPGVVFGVHPESGRMVATTAISSVIALDDQVCINALEMLTLHVRQLRASRTLPLLDEEPAFA
ncbi:type III secretion system chaperone [Ramlibacter rhizophilus]|uniref:Type III secretion system chaperone n=1 Tax=Ramlibacter rhizophilus TaxID=1781167 RepID=A0A4Z0BHK5_9BURK|nr:type III secretion system chaperone [Ramlibacter rhizophilus]TFY97943.1 hypothetical protein EZ242_15950 [Ramlibacter rhizophilus]